MALDHYITLGRSGLRVSPFCLGAMTFGEDLGWGSSVEESQQIIDRYTELGGNFIDTANFYTKSHSEKIVGDHVGRDKARRDRLVIATKFSGNLYPGDPNGGGSSRKAIVGAAENSLRRLQTTTSTSTGSTSGIRTRRSTRRWPHSTISCAPARSATSASPTRRRGRSRKPTPWRSFGAGPPSCPADRIFAARAQRRAGTRPTGAGVRPRRDAVEPAQKRRPQRQIHPRQRRDRKGRPRSLRRWARSTRGPMRWSISSRLSPGSTTHRWPPLRLAWLSAKPGVTSPIVGCAPSRSAGRQHHGARREIDDRRSRQARCADPAQAGLPAKHAADGGQRSSMVARA